MQTMERNEAVRATTMAAGMPWDWETYPEYLDSLERTPKGLNMLSYMGLNPLMSYVMGHEGAKERRATPSESGRDVSAPRRRPWTRAAAASRPRSWAKTACSATTTARR